MFRSNCLDIFCHPTPVIKYVRTGSNAPINRNRTYERFASVRAAVTLDSDMLDSSKIPCPNHFFSIPPLSIVLCIRSVGDRRPHCTTPVASSHLLLRCRSTLDPAATQVSSAMCRRHPWRTPHSTSVQSNAIAIFFTFSLFNLKQT